MTDRPYTGPSSNPATVPPAGRATPQAARPPELDDPRWLRNAYGMYGDRRIAQDLGVTRSTVRRARARLGIESRKQGPRLGVTSIPSVRQRASHDDLDPTERAIIDRIRLWRDRRVPATETTLNAAIRAADDAHRHRADEPNLYDDALLDVAAAGGLLHLHRQKLRRAA